MRTIITILVFGGFISCNQQDKNISETQSRKEVSSGEDFNVFFKKFKSDSLFQISRIDEPLTVIFIQDNITQKTMMDVNEVSFDEKDWHLKTTLNIEKVSKDTMNVVLQAEDTGVYFEHIFALRKGKWYLFQIKDSST